MQGNPSSQPNKLGIPPTAPQPNPSFKKQDKGEQKIDMLTSVVKSVATFPDNKKILTSSSEKKQDNK